MKILYLANTFPPEPGSTQRAFHQAIGLRRLGCQVTVLTAIPSYPTGKIYPDYRGKWFLRENVDGVEVLRIRAIPMPSRGTLRRLLSLFSFVIAAAAAGLCLRRFDLVIARLPSLGTEIAGLLVARFKRSKVLLELEDVPPDNLTLVGLRRDSWMARRLDAYYRWIFRRMDMIAVLCRRPLEMLLARGVARDRIVLWPNGADRDELDRANGGELRERLGIQERFVAVYAGSFSRYYDIPNLVDAAKILRRRTPRIHLLLVGDGTDRPRIERALKENDLTNVSSLGPVPWRDVGACLQAADVFINSLAAAQLPRCYYDHLSAKACEYFMVGRPIISVEDGAVLGRILAETGAGSSVPPRDPESLAKALEHFASNPAACRRCGENARRFALANFERMAITKTFLDQICVRLGLGPESTAIQKDPTACE
jgi:glycosyltransferase involved in cell wall biosynthesis